MSSRFKFRAKKRPWRQKTKGCFSSEARAMSEAKISFKKGKGTKFKARLRGKRATEEESDEDESCWEKLEELKEVRILKRSLQKEINADHQNGNDNDGVSTQVEKKSGGLVDGKSVANELDLGNTFSVETNRRDEDQDMLKFIDEELAKRKGVNDTGAPDRSTTLPKTAEDVFDILPQHLVQSSKRKNEEMLSNQMLSGIPEVDLGIEERIRNIEATEEAKVSLLERRRHRPSSSTSTLVPTNIAANFMQHSRFSLNEDNTIPVTCVKKPKIIKPNTTVVEEPVVVIGDDPKTGKFRMHQNNGQRRLKFPGKEKASDDYHYEKFKKQFKK